MIVRIDGGWVNTEHVISITAKDDKTIITMVNGNNLTSDLTVDEIGSKLMRAHEHIATFIPKETKG